MSDSKQNNKLTIKEKAFCREYVKSGNGLQSLKKAGYNYKTDGCATSAASRLLRKERIRVEIARLTEKKEEKAIMTSAEVMEMFTKIANGEIKDQFGLEASLNDRLKALQELAKRTIDIDNRLKGVGDNNITVKLDWRKSE
jgi:phage terminase small subunit